MSKWWNEDMSDVGQAMYSDPELALQMATIPDNMIATPEQYQKTLKANQEDKGGFLNTIAKHLGKIDGALSNIPGFGVYKNALEVAFYPVDKLAQGARWLYSNTTSQGLSTVLLQAAKADVNDDAMGTIFSGKQWADAWKKADHLSPGQVFMNYENTIAATGDFGAFSSALGLAQAPDAYSHYIASDRGLFGIPGTEGKPWQYTGPLNPDQQEQVKRQTERFLYDKKFWSEAGDAKARQTYNIGSGALDFYFVMFGDPTSPAIKGISNAIKGVRSARFIDDGADEMVRTRGALLDKADKIRGKAPQTMSEYTNGTQMNKFYDWVAQPGLNGERKSAAEIAEHPIWGSGRRQNPFKEQWGQVLAQTPREDMPLIMRFSMGDTSAAKEMAVKGNQTLDNLGRVLDNRQMLMSTKLDDEMMSYFAQKQAGVPTASIPTTRLFEPPYPRPTTPGPRQSGWDARWGSLAKEAQVHEAAVKATASARAMGPFGGISEADVAAANTWKAGKIALIDDEVTRLTQEKGALGQMLGANLGKTADELTLADSNMFGTLERAYRMGTNQGSEWANLAANEKFAKQVMNRKGEFAVQGIRKGFYGTPTRVIQSFGDRAPEGRVNHNDDDAGSRVLDMLKQVPKMDPQVRAALLDRYLMAGDKVARSQELEKINSEVLQHMATNVHNVDPQLAGILNDMIKVGIGKTMSDLTGGRTSMTDQAFSAAPAAGARKTVDRVEMGDGAYVVSPLAKTQLSMTDTLLPVKEIDRVLSRNSGAMQQLRRAGGNAADTARVFSDSFNTIWKAATLLRPAYIPRMISEEWFASAIKFGAMSRLVADPSIGTKNFILNRGSSLAAQLGKGSYTPGTGEIEKAVVKLGDESLISKIKARQDEIGAELETATGARRAQLEAEQKYIGVTRIKVGKALPVANNRIAMEQELKANLEKDITGWKDEIEKLEGSQLIQDQLRAQGLKDKISSAEDEILDHMYAIEEFTEYSDELLRIAAASTGRRLGEGSFEAFGRQVPQAFSKEWQNSIPRESLSSDDAYQKIYARGEALDTARAIKTGSWEYIAPDQVNHMASWLRGLNFQFRQDDVFRRVANDMTGKEALAWLKTPDGAAHMRDLGSYRSPVELVNDVRATINKYLPVASLQQKLAKGEEIGEAELRANIPRNEFPIVHGEEMKYPTRLSHKDTAASKVDRIIAKGFKRLGAIPSDLMSRHPVYARAFEARFRTIMDQELKYKGERGNGDALVPEELEKIKAKADKLARKDISQVVYDPQRTTASEALRFIAPFFSAHADSLSRWGGLIAEKPETLGTIAKIYNAPVAANLITDSQGNPVGLDGKATKKVPIVEEVTDPITGRKFKKITGEKTVREDVNMSDRVFHLRNPFVTPEMAKGDRPIKISAMNTILPGDPWFNPGTGPIVQIAGSQIAKASPQTGDFLQWAKILPYGPSSVSDAITPKYMRAAWDMYRGEDPDNEEYQKAYLAVYNRKVAEYYENGTKFSPKDVESEAKKFLFLDFLEAWGSPAQTQATPITGTKYQFFVDAYSQLKAADPQNAKDIFMERYGSDYFGFTADLTKSMGIAATHSADAMAQKYKDLLDEDPDMAPFIIGNVYNNGAFSPSVYRKQLEQSFGGEWVREKISAQDAIAQSQTDQGWAEWNQLKNTMDGMLIRSGFTSYTQKGAEKFNEARAKVVSALSSQFPAWGQAYATTDRSKIPTRISAFERLVTDERFQNDPMRAGETQSLMAYLQARRVFKSALDARGAKELSVDVSGRPTGKNADLGLAWNRFTMGLVAHDTGFATTYNRWLSNDHLQ